MKAKFVKEIINEEKEEFKTITIECRGPLEKLIDYIKKNGNTGHSFSIVVDPDIPENKKEFGWDGDGSDRINSIKVNGEEYENIEEK